MATIKRRRKDDNRAGKLCISLILIAFVAAMSVQIARTYKLDQECIERQAQKEAELEAEEAYQQELEQYERYTQTPEFVEDIAKSKLGLAYENEIIFKEIE